MLTGLSLKMVKCGLLSFYYVAAATKNCVQMGFRQEDYYHTKVQCFRDDSYVGTIDFEKEISDKLVSVLKQKVSFIPSSSWMRFHLART